MHSSRPALSLLLFALVIRVSPVLASDAQWVEIQSPHFSVVTDAGEKRGREVAMRFEQMRAVFAALMTKANVNLPIPLQIVAFRNNKELRQVVPLWHGKPIQVAGLFQGGQDRSFIMLDMSVENPYGVVFHEYAHQLMNGVLATMLDPWFEEGFAEYFSSIEVDSKEARVGKIRDYEYEILQQQGWMKVADLLKVQQNSATYNESGDRRTVFYAESSLLVHYLYDNNLLLKLATYFNLKMDKGMPVEDAIQQTFGMNAAEFDKTLRNYVGSGRYKYYPIPAPANINGKDYPVKPISLGDAGAVIADIHLHSPDYHQKAAAEFEEILKTEPHNAAACRGLGYAYLQAGNFDQAAKYFRQAVQLDSKDPRVHYLSALLMSREGTFAEGSDISEMTRELNAAIALDPNFADAHMLLAFTQARAGDPASALLSMQKAVSLSPRNMSYRLDLAQMYLNNQQADKGIAILQALSKSSDPMVSQQSSQLLAQAQEFKASVEASRLAAAARPTSAEMPASGSAQVQQTSATSEGVPAVPDQSPIKFLKGTVLNVDCSSLPLAILRVDSGKKTWNMKVPDSKHVLVIGADQFSCNWSKQKIALNYRESGDAAGTVISIEVQ